MRIIDYIIYLLPEETYSFLSVIYLVKLNILNRELLSINFSGPFELLTYKEWTPIKYFGIALIVLLAGLGVLWHRVYCVKNSQHGIGIMIASILAMATVVILIALLYILIRNPILRAIFAVGGLIVALAYVHTN